MLIQRYLIKTGKFAGQIFDGVGCNARATPESEPNTELYNDGIYIPALGLRFPEERDSEAKHCGQTLHYEDLVVAFDKYDIEIFVGDEIYAAVGKIVCRLTVVKMTALNHVGYGWMQRKMRCVDVDSGKTVTINIPAHTIKI